MVLMDDEIIDLLEAGELLRYPKERASPRNANDWMMTYYEAWDRKKGGPDVRAASLNLTIGWIYLPEREEGKRGSLANPLRSYELAPGHAAVIETREMLVMPTDCAGLVFTRPAFSSRGLLLTNPGHVDPGFMGPLCFTVINMGKDAIELRRSQTDPESWLANMTVLRGRQPAGTDWLQRKWPSTEELSGAGAREAASPNEEEHLAQELDSPTEDSTTPRNRPRAFDLADAHEGVLRSITTALTALEGLLGTGPGYEQRDIDAKITEVIRGIRALELDYSDDKLEAEPLKGLVDNCDQLVDVCQSLRSEDNIIDSAKASEVKELTLQLRSGMSRLPEFVPAECTTAKRLDGIARESVQSALASLGTEFVNVEGRATEAARQQITTDTVRISVVVAVLFLVVTIVGMTLSFSAGADSVSNLAESVKQLAVRVQCVEAPKTRDACPPASFGGTR